VEAVTLYYLLNPVRFSLLESTGLELEALDAWALQVELVALPEAEKVPHDSLDVLDEIDVGSLDRRDRIASAGSRFLVLPGHGVLRRLARNREDVRREPTGGGYRDTLALEQPQ
jgi:hypothetical protein